MILGLPSGTVSLHRAHDEWARAFEHEAQRIESAIGPYILDVRHIGSTAIKGVPAKPILDRLRYVMEAHVMPTLGEVPVDRLTANRIRRWHEALADKPAHVRTSKHSRKRQVRHAKTADEKRARKVTANRSLTALKAALHRRWLGNRRVVGPWSEVAPFRDVDRSRDRYLDTDEAQRLVNACEPDFRALVQGAVYTGQRYGELARLRVADVNLDACAVAVRESKSGKPRYVFLNDEALAFFEAQAAGCGGDETLFRRADGEPWGHGHQHKRMKAACERAGIDPPIGFHGFRHGYASSYLMNGGGLPDLAKQLGHTSTRMVEEHYGHLADAWRAERARQFAPTLGVKPGKVRRMRGRR